MKHSKHIAIKGERSFQIIGNIVMILLTAIAILPLILQLMASLTDNNTLIRNGYSFLPEKFSLAAYEYIFFGGNAVIRAYGMSFLVTGIGILIGLTITTLLGYALSKKNLPGRGLMTFYVVFTLLFHGGLTPTYINYTNVIGLKNTLWALIIPSLLMNAINVIMVKSYFVTNIPDEIMDAASIDGASEFKAFARVALPMAKPIIATVGLFIGIGYWNDWMNGYIYLTNRTDLYSIQNLLNRMVTNIRFLQQNSTVVTVTADLLPSVSIRMAISIAGILPIVLIYPFIQNSFVKGITLGGVKG